MRSETQRAGAWHVARSVQPQRTGRVVNGAVVLDDPRGLVEGASVRVWISESDDSFTATDEELVEIDLGVQSAAEEPLIDARSFLAELRREG